MQTQLKKSNLILWTIEPNGNIMNKKKKMCKTNTFSERGYKDIMKKKIEMKNTNTLSLVKKKHDKRNITDILNLSINTHPNKSVINTSIDNINSNNRSFIQTTHTNFPLKIAGNNSNNVHDIKTPTSYYNHTFTKRPMFKPEIDHKKQIQSLFFPNNISNNATIVNSNNNPFGFFTKIKKIKPKVNLNFFTKTKTKSKPKNNNINNNNKLTSKSNRSNNSNTSNSNNTSTNNTSNNNINTTFHNISTNYLIHTPKSKIMSSISVNRSTDDIKGCRDDKDGNYIITLGEFLINRYEIINSLGKGAFGHAVKCYDHASKEYVCVKIIKNKPKFSAQSKIEINILKFLNSHDTKKYSNIVSLKNHFVYREHICLVFELLSKNLYDVIQMNNYIGFDLSTIKKFATQILFSLLLLKKYKIIHCDLKPENILLITNGKTGIKLIDFGSSCFSNEKLYTYIQSRFYRSPEVLLGLEYDVEIDMWSLGCILCELYMGYPIFPGEDEYDMVYYIMEYFGKPPFWMIENAKKRDLFFDEDGEVYEKENSFGKIRRPNTKLLENFLVNADEDFTNFVKNCLQWDYKRRITPEEALRHKWICKEMPKEVLKVHYKKIKEMGSILTLTNNNSSDNTKKILEESNNNKISNCPTPNTKKKSVNYCNNNHHNSGNNTINNNFNLTFNVQIDFTAHLCSNNTKSKKIKNSKYK